MVLARAPTLCRPSWPLASQQKVWSGAPLPQHTHIHTRMRTHTSHTLLDTRTRPLHTALSTCGVREQRSPPGCLPHSYHYVDTLPPGDGACPPRARRRWAPRPRAATASCTLPTPSRFFAPVAAAAPQLRGARVRLLVARCPLAVQAPPATLRSVRRCSTVAGSPPKALRAARPACPASHAGDTPCVVQHALAPRARLCCRAARCALPSHKHSR